MFYLIFGLITRSYNINIRIFFPIQKIVEKIIFYYYFYCMNLCDFERLKNNIFTEGLFGSDSAVASFFLLQNKYNIDFFTEQDFLFRRYHGSFSRDGYAFPLALKKDAELKNALDSLIKKSELQKEHLNFCLCTREQKSLIDSCLQSFSNRKIEWNSNRNDSDYVYLSKNLANLQGQKFHKKKNHVSHFMHTYENRWQYKSFPQNDIANDILKVEEVWFKEKILQSGGIENLEKAVVFEKESVKSAVENAYYLGIFGGVLYVDENPIAMTLASSISDLVVDVHFEKAIFEYAKDGAYAVINNLFAKQSSNFLYINREEDMGIEGLRKAKLSYKPDIVLDKFYGTLI